MASSTTAAVSPVASCCAGSVNSLATRSRRFSVILLFNVIRVVNQLIQAFRRRPRAPWPRDAFAVATKRSPLSTCQRSFYLSFSLSSDS